MSAFMKFYDDDGVSIEVGKSFNKEDKILFEIEGEYTGGAVCLDKEDVNRLIEFLSSILSKKEKEK